MPKLGSDVIGAEIAVLASDAEARLPDPAATGCRYPCGAVSSRLIVALTRCVARTGCGLLGQALGLSACRLVRL